MAKHTDHVLERWLLERLRQRLAIGVAGTVAAGSALEAGGQSLPGAASPAFEPLPSSEVSIGLEQLFSSASQHSQSSDFFLQPATLPAPADFGVLAYAFVSSGDLHTAINVALTHPLFHNSYARWSLAAASSSAEHAGTAQPGAQEQQITLRQETLKSLPEPAAAALSDEALSSLLGLLRWRQGFYPEGTVEAVRLVVAQTGRASTEDYQRHFGLAPAADGRRTEMLLQLEQPESLQEQPRSQSENLLSLLGDNTAQLMQQSQRLSGMGGQLTRTLIDSFGRVGKADRAAKALHTSERTMRRRLSQENTSFQRILDQYRAALAEDYLTDTALSTQQIGELLGFTEATNFRRAFLRWCGRSPHDYRSALKLN